MRISKRRPASSFNPAANGLIDDARSGNGLAITGNMQTEISALWN
jgi:hypothetical protein